MHDDPASFSVRLLRIVRVAGHIVRGLWVTGVHFPRLDAAGQNHEIRRWARRLLAILNVRVACLNAPETLPRRCVLVANHVSWLDVMTVFAVQPSVFVAKDEVRRWPLLGRLCAQAGTLFIARGNRRHAKRINGCVGETLSTGRVFAMFPEGTTTDGRSLNPFHRALFQSAVDAEATLQPIGIRYTRPDGTWSDAPAYFGDRSITESLWRIVSSRSLVAELHFAPPIEARNGHRRDLAELAEQVIAGVLGLAPPRRTPETRSDPRDAPQSAGLPIHSHYQVPAGRDG
jgi:1-acyl-sn-glycerol-3-phosphate acyltransferase